jgi:putative inorganic carbon (HCO3(-)) transporter
MLAEVISNKKRLLGILITIIASALLLTADAAVQYYAGRDFLRGCRLDTFCASFFAASGFAGWLIVIIPVLLGVLLADIITNRKIRFLLFADIIILSLYLIRTYSRGAWIGFFIAILIIAFYYTKNFNFITKATLLITGVSLIALFLLLLSILSPQVKYNILTKFKFSQDINIRIKSIPQMRSGSNLERARLWKESLRIIRDYPLVGCGLNNYSIVARNYKSFEGGGVYPHNSFLQKTAETGIFGLMAFLFVLFSYFKAGFCYLNKKMNYLVLCLLSGIIAFLVQSFFDTNLYSLQMVILFWYMLGFTIAVIRLDYGDKIL